MSSDLTIPELDALVLPSARGRRAAPLSIEYVRDLNAGDVEVLLAPAAQGLKAPVLKQLRNSHHLLARLLAEGRKPGEAALVTGYSLSRISILQQDPAFQELVAHYATIKEAQYLDVHQRLAALGMSAIDELQERLEREPDNFALRELMELAELCLDRSVTRDAGPKGRAGGPAVALNISFVAPKAQEIEGTATVINVEAADDK